MFEWLPRDLTGVRCAIASFVSSKDRTADERLQLLAGTIVERGGKVVGTLVQRRGVSRTRGPGGAQRLTSPLHPTTLFGAGKVEELARLVETRAANLVVIGNPLKTSQKAELEARSKCKIASPMA